MINRLRLRLLSWRIFRIQLRQARLDFRREWLETKHGMLKDRWYGDE